LEAADHLIGSEPWNCVGPAGDSAPEVLNFVGVTGGRSPARGESLGDMGTGKKVEPGKLVECCRRISLAEHTEFKVSDWGLTMLSFDDLGDSKTFDDLGDTIGFSNDSLRRLSDREPITILFS